MDVILEKYETILWFWLEIITLGDNLLQDQTTLFRGNPSNFKRKLFSFVPAAALTSSYNLYLHMIHNIKVMPIKIWGFNLASIVIIFGGAFLTWSRVPGAFYKKITYVWGVLQVDFLHGIGEGHLLDICNVSQITYLE